MSKTSYRIILSSKLRNLLMILVCGFITVPGTMQPLSAAGSATYSFSPATASVVKDQTLSITLNVTSSTPINAVQAYMTYNEDNMQFISFNTSGTSFEIDADTSESNGTIRISRGTVTPVTGTKKVVTINFKALITSGSAGLDFDDANTHIVSSADSSETWDGNYSGGNYSFAAPSSGDSSPSGNSGGSAGTSNSGSAGSGQSSPSEEEVVDAPEVETKTFAVEIEVSDNDDQKVAGADVVLGGSTVKTDSSGIAKFSGIAAGVYQAVVRMNDSENTKEITVEDADPAITQKFYMSLQNSPANNGLPKNLILIFVPIGIILILAVIALLGIYQSNTPDIANTFIKHSVDNSGQSRIKEKTDSGFKALKPNPLNPIQHTKA
jgi:hypothetical protein